MAVPPTTELDARARQQLGLTGLSVLGLSAWLLDLSAVYAVSTHECDVPRWSWTIAIAGVVLTAAALGLGVKEHRRPHDRQARFLIQFGLMLNALALLLTLGFIAPLAVLRPCE